MIVLDFKNKPYWYPGHSILNALVYAAQGTDVCLTMVDGKVLYQDGNYLIIDIEKAIAEAEESVARILLS